MTQFFSTRLRTVIAGVAMVGLIGMAGCNKSDDDYDDMPDAPVAGLMAFNLASDKVVNVSLSGNNLTGVPLNYTSFSGAYLRVYTGTRPFESRDANAGNILATTSFTFDSAKYYSAFVLGTIGAYKNVITEDNFDSLSGANGQAYVRYINAIVDSVNTPNVNITANGTSISNRAAAYGTVSGFAAVAPGNVNVAITNGGTATKDRTISLQQQKAYTVLLLGVPGSTNTADSVQIRFIENGTLDGARNGRTTGTSTQAVKFN